MPSPAFLGIGLVQATRFTGGLDLFFGLCRILSFSASEYRRLPEKPGKQRHQRDADECYTATGHELFYPQLGVKLCSMAGGGVQKIYMVFLREPSRRDRSGSDLFHLRDGFEIKMNFDRNVSCFILVNALMHDDFFD